MRYSSNSRQKIVKIVFLAVCVLSTAVSSQDRSSASGGVAQWVSTVSTGTNGSSFAGMAVDIPGNVYVVGNIWGRETYTFGPGVTATGLYGTANAVLVKYESGGKAQWARTITAATFFSMLHAVAVDTSGNVYVAGYIGGGKLFGFGADVTVAGCTAEESSVLLVKYDPNGTALWARSVSTGPRWSQFRGVAVDGAGNVFAAGFIWGTETYTFGPDVTATGTNTLAKEASNVVLVKYDSSGMALWAKTVSSGSGTTQFDGVAVDGSGSAYVVGLITGGETYTFGPGVTAAGEPKKEKAVLVKYNPNGEAQWVSTELRGQGSSCFRGVAMDASGGVCVAGNIDAKSGYMFGPGVVAAGSSTGSNAVLVRYDAAGKALWARTVSTSPNPSMFNAVAVDSSGNAYAAGLLDQTAASGTYTFGPDVTVQTTRRGYSIILVKYDKSGKALWATSASAWTDTNVYNGVAADLSGNVYAAGHIKGTGTFSFGPNVEAKGLSPRYTSAILVKYTSQ